MKKTILLLIYFLSVFVANGQEPAPPTQEWCKWAFQQLPDHRDISEVDAKAFSVDFHTLLKIAFAINDWEIEKDPGYIGSGEFLAYWYAGNGDSPSSFRGHSIQYKVGKVKDGKTSVEITIRIPERPPYEPVNLRFTMYLVYENESWRIDDWFNWDFNERGFEGSMREDCRRYISWYANQIPEKP
jgi:hypothetical protein